ncbi:P pilus assembly protein%2C pilin FimA [Yersinia massiliensis]|uniref:fimbrial protein n=1 Tax=Yersinia massiliensis TaxID=419257 RepID=UPI0005E4109F|nr:fimbrial protein [Yersinia massiliensis]CNI16991.1 P pilus assembly protein%2C pilin FimA [Yersinia massiliensis]
MKFSINKIVVLLGGLLFATISTSSWAVVNCSFAAGAAQTETVPLSPPMISAGADIPVGTVIYQGTWQMKNTLMSCKWELSDLGKSFWYSSSTLISHAPLPLSNLMTGPFAGAVYQTNIPGIGVVISRARDGNPVLTTRAPVITDAELVINKEFGALSGGFDYSSYIRYISLVKTGPITPGNFTISGANFPTFKIAHEPAANNHPGSATLTGLPFTFYTINFQGSLTVSAQTCTTPNVYVAMGSYDIRDNFNRINSTSPWVDASINMTGCPTFHGFYDASNTTMLMDYKTGVGTATASNSNSIGVSLTPTTEVIDAANGIMAIDSSVPGAASGVGIQIASGSSSQTPTPFNFMAEQRVTLPKDGSSTIRVPLVARYIQTKASVMPGRADGKVVFLINYY